MGASRFGSGAVYPYQALPPGGDPAGVRRPLLPVRLRRGSRTLDTFLAIVDSGADVSTFPLDLASRLGIDLDDPGQCRRTRVRGVSGPGDAYSCAVEIEVEGRRFSSHVSFAPILTAVLGQLDVFWHFRICFDERAEEFLVEPYP